MIAFELVAAIVVGAGLIAWLGTGALIPLLRRRALLDRPNERSLHVIPTPRGGGIAVITAIVVAWWSLTRLGLLALPAAPILVGALIVAAAGGFLVWNWAPGRIFLGDVGSVPLGYLLGFLLLDQASRGRWKLALILPLYFLADATITLLHRLARRERIWEPHRRHFYQGAVQRGFGHAAIVERVIAANIVLIGCGWAAENGWPIVGLAVAGITGLLLLGWLAIARPAR